MSNFVKIFLFSGIAAAASVSLAVAQTGTTSSGTTSSGNIVVSSQVNPVVRGLALSGALVQSGASLSGAVSPDTKAGIVCTAEYNPVCALPAGTGATAKIYSNSCRASADNATVVANSQCQAIVGNDLDKNGCKSSAGYSWDETLLQCVRPFDTETIYNWSKKIGLTTTANVTDFAPDRNISREEVAAIIERSFSKNIFANKVIGNLSELKFSDKSAIASEFVNSVKFNQAANIIRGNGTNFYPKNSISNYEILLMLARSISADSAISNTDAESLMKIVVNSTANDQKFLTQFAKRSDVFLWIKQFMQYQKNTKIVTATPIETLTAGTWRLDYIINVEGKTLPMPESTSLFVSKNSFSARICNLLNGEITLTNNQITLNGALVGTRMACDDANVRYAEQNFILKKADYAFSADKKLLTISADTGVKFVFSRS